MSAAWRHRGAAWLRRSLQMGVWVFLVYAALGGVWRNYKVAHNSRRLVALMHGETWGWLYGFNEDLLQRFGEAYAVSLTFLGVPWSATVAGIPVSDPVMALAQSMRGAVTWPLGLGIITPVLLALVAGKVFCSHLCPARLLFEVGQAVRRGLLRLGFALPSWRHPRRFGGWVLLGGLAATMTAGMAVWWVLLPYLSAAGAVLLGITGGAVAPLVVVVMFWVGIDAALAPGYFCHNLCPTGFVLEQLGRVRLARLLRLRHRDERPCPSPCPRSCQACERACPYGLSPKLRAHEPACDGCGACVAACPEARLRRQWALPLLGLLAVVLPPSAAGAHHNKGLPHYGYFENYAQVPTDDVVAVHGRWEIGATVFNFQGLDRRSADTPNDVKIYLYVYDATTSSNYTGRVRFELRHAGELVSHFERDTADTEMIYSTRETLPRSGEYELVAMLATEPPATLRLPFDIDLGEGGVRWGWLTGLGLPVAAIFVLALKGRRRRRQRARRRPRAQQVVAPVLVAMLLPLAATAAEVCKICGMVGCTMQHFGGRDGAMMMVMGGIPRPLFLVAIGAVIVLSFVGIECFGRGAPRDYADYADGDGQEGVRQEGVRQALGFRVNLLASRAVYRVVRHRWFQVLPQLFNVALFVALVWAGLVGSRVSNITPVAVWTLWWAGLIFSVVLFGPVFCFACPWDGLANLASRLRLAARVEPLNIGLRFPRWLKNVYPAIGLFVILTWLELGYGVTTDPRWTAYMGLGMAALAVVAALLWDGKQFCRWGCPVGRISGIYANFAPVEVRPRSLSICAKCRTEDCLHGNDFGYGCPTGISLKTVQGGTYCTLCSECIKTCTKRNVAVNLRPFGADLRRVPVVRHDEAWLALTLLTLTLFHGFSMTPAWENYQPGAMSLLKWLAVQFGTPRLFNFTVAMAVVAALPIALYALSCRAGAWLAGDPRVSPRQLFVQFSYSLLPVALFYHLAHNAMHIAMEGGTVVALLSDPLGRGANYLGTRGLHLGSMLSEQSLWLLQISLVLVGHLYGIVVAHRAGHKLYADRHAATRSLIPMLLVMVVVSVVGLGLMHLDMNMRVGRM